MTKNKVRYGLLSLLLVITLFAGCKVRPTQYKGTITLTRLGSHTDAGGVETTLNETLELTGVTLKKIGRLDWLNQIGVNISTKAEIHDSYILPESADPINWSKTYFLHELETFTQSETVISLAPVDVPEGGLEPLESYELAVTGFNIPNVEETVTDQDGTITTYDKYPILGQVVSLNIPDNYGRITGSKTEDVDGIPWTMAWDFIAN